MTTTIRNWQAHLATIYPNADKSPDYLMAHAYTKSSELARILIRGERHLKKDPLVMGTLAWLMAIASHFKIDFESALVDRFPAVCSYCLSCPCKCDRTGKQARASSGRSLSPEERQEELQHKRNAIRNAGVVVDFSWLLDRIHAIYPANRSLLLKGGHAYVVSKMLEEGGEVHRAYSEYLLGRANTEKIGSELADFSAWVVSCWDLDGTGANIDSELARTFLGGCPLCKQKPCICPTYSITKGQEDLIREIGTYLRELKAKGIKKDEIDEAIALASDLETKGGRQRSNTLLQKIQGVVEYAKTAKTGSEAVSGTVKNLADALDVLRSLFNS